MLLDCYGTGLQMDSNAKNGRVTANVTLIDATYANACDNAISARTYHQKDILLDTRISLSYMLCHYHFYIPMIRIPDISKNNDLHSKKLKHYCKQFHSQSSDLNSTNAFITPPLHFVTSSLFSLFSFEPLTHIIDFYWPVRKYSVSSSCPFHINEFDLCKKTSQTSWTHVFSLKYRSRCKRCENIDRFCQYYRKIDIVSYTALTFG